MEVRRDIGAVAWLRNGREGRLGNGHFTREVDYDILPWIMASGLLEATNLGRQSIVFGLGRKAREFSRNMGVQILIGCIQMDYIHNEY